MSEQQSRGSRTQRKWLGGCVGVIALCALLTYTLWFLWGYVPLSTLPVKKSEVDECDGERLWPPSGNLPADSPDSRYYLDVNKAEYRYAWEIRLYEKNTMRVMGSYSYHMLHIFCWAKDSSGIYLADFGRSGGIFNIFPNLPPGTGVIETKKVMVPCQSKLDGVSFVPRLYWEMRCAFPQPHGFVAVWLPLVVVAALVVLTGWLGFKGVSHGWRRWIRP